MKVFEVYVPCIYSEIHVVEAKSAQEAIDIVQSHKPTTCIGESVTGLEHQGFRAVEIVHRKGPQRKKVQHE